MTTINVNTHESAKEAIFAFIKEQHFLGEDGRDITVVLDREDTLDFIKSVDSSLYSTVLTETEGEYFYVSSSVVASELYIENVRTEDGIKDHEGDILILPHYVPQEVKQACIDGSAIVIELALEGIYEKLVKIIEM